MTTCPICSTSKKDAHPKHKGVCGIVITIPASEVPEITYTCPCEGTLPKKRKETVPDGFL